MIDYDYWVKSYFVSVSWQIAYHIIECVKYSLSLYLKQDFAKNFPLEGEKYKLFLRVFCVQNNWLADMMLVR